MKQHDYSQSGFDPRIALPSPGKPISVPVAKEKIEVFGRWIELELAILEGRLEAFESPNSRKRFFDRS